MVERFEEFVQNIESAHKSIVKLKAYEINKFGLKAANVMCLFFLGKHSDGLTPSELCELCGEDKAGISKSLAVLKKLNYISGNDDGNKKYRIKYKITEYGKEVCDEINKIIVNIVDKVGKGLTDEERIIFYKSLETIVLNLQKLCGQLETK